MTNRNLNEPDHQSQGAFVQPDGSVMFRVWAPFAEDVMLVTWNGNTPSVPDAASVRDTDRSETPMTAEHGGYFTAVVRSAELIPHNRHLVRNKFRTTSMRYAYRLNGGDPRPDPATRWQPDGVNQPSAVFDPDEFEWSDASWTGVARDDLVIYELHVGAFTPEGTFAAVVPRLEALRELGVTAIEIMPVAQFSGTRNWGYDGVHPFAVQNSYGGPRELQKLVDAAHRIGMAVILDVVYNHLGPEGNYLREFGPYFTDRYHTPWGPAINYDGPDCDPVRRFVCDNVRMWVRDFHADGLRLDAIQTIYDFSARHILADIHLAAHEEPAAISGGRRSEVGGQRSADQLHHSITPSLHHSITPRLHHSPLTRIVHVIGETNQNDARLTARPEAGGIGLDAVWSDDLHHGIHALLTGERGGYYLDFGEPRQLAKALNDTFVYDGCYSPFHRRRFGSSVAGQDRSRFVVCIQNHDQVGNRALGERLDVLVTPAARRLAAALLLLCPGTPLLFMGEEYGETRPFPFFCSFSDPQLVEAVRSGRRREFAELAFEWGETIPDPQSEATFDSARLTWNWPAGSSHAQLRTLYRDLLQVRRESPALRDRNNVRAELSGEPGASATGGLRGLTPTGSPQSVLTLHRGAGLVAYANLSEQTANLSSLKERAPQFSTESPRYGGERTAATPLETLLPFELLLFGDAESVRSDRLQPVSDFCDWLSCDSEQPTG
jgi:maltooligosyltrehalose trehalohydrolase